MEELGSTRHWEKKPHGSTVFARSAYDDFFGGPPKQTTTFPARFEDYCEIFGNAAAASSIPVLDLPLDDEEFVSAGDGDRQVVVDYSDIFGGLSGSGFAVSYEELFGGSKRSGVSSLDVSARWGVFPEQQANEASEDLMEGYSEDNLANLDKAEVSVPHHSDDASSKLFSMSYNKTSWGIIDDLIGEKTNTAKLDAIPEFTLPVDASDPVLEMKNQEVNEPMANNTGTKRHTHDVGQENEAPSNSSPNAAYSENLRVDQVPSKYICDSLLDASEIEKHHSRSSSYHSASSGDTALSDVDYLNISEISLQTKPLQGPPPSRPPPQLIKKQEHPKMAHVDSSLLRPMPKHHIISSSGATKIHAVDENMEGNSCCYDYEMDPNSAAAASVAAVKAAMEQAQARLKVAKELMDRKRDKYKRKVDQPKVMACEDDRADYEVALKSCSKVMAAKNMLKENNYSINEYTILEREEIKNAKFNEVSDEWKTEKKYYDLIRNGSLLKKVEDNYTHENEKNAKTDVNGCQDIYKDGKKGEQFFEVLKDQKLPEASRSIEKLENDHNLNGASMAYMNDSNNNVVNAIVEDFVLMESASKLNEAYDYHILDDTKKEGDVHEDNTIEDGDNSLKSAVDSCLRKSSEKDFQISNEEIEINGAEKIFRNVGNKMEFHVDHVNFELNESHKLFNFATEAIFQGRRSDEEGRESDGVCSNNTTGKMEVTKETRKFNENGRETESMKYPYASNVSDACKVEENNNAKEVDDADGLQINEEACILTKNELEKEIIQDINGLENGNERRDAPIELQENKSVGPDMNQELHNSEFSAEVESDYAENQSENSSEVPVACNFWENETVSTSAKEVCQQGEESDAPEIILSGKEDNSPAETPDTTEASYAEVAENHKHTVYTEEEENRKADREKERDKERALRLEEKEREKEREKDRIAVEIANQRAFAEARERAERIAVERIAAEARQRALAEAREKAEKAAEAEKALREARLRAERAAVERATEEARQRAIEKALVEKAAIEARSRKGNATAYFKAAHVKEDSDTRVKSSSEILQNTQSQCPACSTNGQRYSDSCDNGGSESKLRCKARQERQQRTAERAAKALAEKNLRDILAQREQAERDRLAESLDAEVRRWSNGKEGNLRALLSTLQYILGSDSGWQPIPLTDVLTAAAVKKAYRKATLSVHPDKLQQRGATIQQKYICEKVFDLLKEAWNKFNSGNDGR